MSRSDGGSERRTAAFVQIDEYMAGVHGDGRLPPRLMERYRDMGYDIGWQISPMFSDGICRRLHVIADHDFPYTPPRIAVADGPDALVWPHLEKGGLLCVLPSDAAVSSRSPVDVTAYVLGEACQLIEDSISGSNVEDFRQEFLSYWALGADAPLVFLSTIDPTCQSRRIAVWRGKGMRVVGDSREALGAWLPRWDKRPERNGEYTFFDGYWSGCQSH